MMTTATWYSIAKAMHLVGMVSWMAGMFYLVRILVYHAMSSELASPEKEILGRQYELMEQKAYKVILQPALVITWAFGVMMLSIQPSWLMQSWLWVKLGFVIFLTLYTFSLQQHMRKLREGTSTRSHLYFRVLNEVPTIALVGVAFLAVFRERISFAALFIGILIFVGLIAWGIWKANLRGTS